jgi:hypothetical protein
MPCCSLYFGTQPDPNSCLLTTPITRNSTAFYYFPFANPPVANKGRIIYLRLFSGVAISNITMRIYVGSPLVNGQFTTDPTQLCEYPLTGSWVAGPNGLYKNSAFSFTPTQSQVTNNVCFVAKVSCPGTSGCSCVASFANIASNPLAAVFDRPWP